MSEGVGKARAEEKPSGDQESREQTSQFPTTTQQIRPHLDPADLSIYDLQCNSTVFFGNKTAACTPILQFSCGCMAYI